MDCKITSFAAVKEIFPYFGHLDTAYKMGIQLNRKSQEVFLKSRRVAAENDLFERRDANLELKTIDDLSEIEKSFPPALELFKIKEQILRDEKDIKSFTEVIQEIEPCTKFREIFVSLHHNREESHSFITKELEKTQSLKEDLVLDEMYNILVKELKKRKMLSCLTSFLNYNDKLKRNVKYVKNLVIRLSKEDKAEVVKENIKTFCEIQNFEYDTVMFQLIPKEYGYGNSGKQYLPIFNNLDSFSNLRTPNIAVCCYESNFYCRKGFPLPELFQEFLRIPVFFGSANCEIFFGRCPSCLSKAFLPNMKNSCTVYDSEKVELEFKQKNAYFFYKSGKIKKINKRIIKGGRMYGKFSSPSSSPTFQEKQFHISPLYCRISLSPSKSTTLTKNKDLTLSDRFKLPNLSLMLPKVIGFQIDNFIKIRCILAMRESLKSLDLYAHLNPLKINLVVLHLSDWMALRLKEKEYEDWVLNVEQLLFYCQDVLDPDIFRDMLQKLARLQDWQRKVISCNNIYQALMVLECGELLSKTKNLYIKCKEKPDKIQKSMLEAAFNHIDPNKIKVIFSS